MFTLYGKFHKFLFLLQVINNIFDDPLSFHKTDLKEESKTNISESPNALEVHNKKFIIESHYEELSPFTLSTITKNMKSPPCNKPTIIIEDSDSDILSHNPFNHSRQPSIIGCEKLSSSCISNKVKSIENEKHGISASALSVNCENDNSMHEMTEGLSCMQNDKFKTEMNITNNSTEEQVNENDADQIDLLDEDNVPYEKLRDNDKGIHFTSEQVNCLSLTNPSLDKYNNNHFSDKLRINSNAKLINVVTDNPALINNYIFKPMVVIQKLKDEVFRDYSNNICRKNEIAPADKTRKSDENDSSNTCLSDNEDKTPLNLDLLNGNLTDLVSVTEIDLEKDEQLPQANLTHNKEAENIKCNGPGTSDGSKSVSCPLRPIIKSEKIDDDELEDSDYIERLSKSILESMLDYNDVKSLEENRMFCSSDVKNGSCERILVVDRENQSLRKDNAIIRDKNSKKENSPNRVISFDNMEGIEESNSPKSNGAVTSIVSSALPIGHQISTRSDMNHKIIYFCEKDEFFDRNKDNIKDKEDEMMLNYNSSEIKINDVNKTFGTSLVENKKLSLENGETSYLSENTEWLSSSKKFQNSNVENNENGMSPNEKNHCKSQIEFYHNMESSENEICSNISHFPSDSSIITETSVRCSQQHVQEKEVIREKNTNGLPTDSDCEIVKILFPSNSKILKPIGFKRMKPCGGVIKKVIKNGMLLTASRNRQNLNISSKENCVDIKKLCSKTSKFLKSI